MGTPINVVIVDDEKHAIISLTTLLKQFNEVNILKTFSNAIHALEYAFTQKPDLIFLDIQMPDLSGIEFAKRFIHSGIFIPIIFTTAYDHYLLDALRNNALDYLLKPVSTSELTDAIQRFKSKHKPDIDFYGRLQNLIEPKKRRKLRFNTRNGFITFYEDEIIYILADGVYSKIQLKNGREVILSQNLGKIEKLIQLPDLVKIHRSCIINGNYLFEVNRGKRKCLLSWNGQNLQLPVSLKGITLLESLVGNVY